MARRSPADDPTNPRAPAVSARQPLSRPKRQAAILEGAANAFARKGFAATSMEEVASASGITKLIVYRHFASKEQLYRAVLDRTFQLLAAALSERTRRSESAPGLRAVLEVGRTYPDGLRLLLVHACREPAFGDYAAQIRARIVAAVQARSRVRDRLFVRWSAEIVVTYVFESVLGWLEMGNPARDEDFIARCSAGLMAMTDAWRAAEETSER
jgi:AcrR family transcriptional regulator